MLIENVVKFEARSNSLSYKQIRKVVAVVHNIVVLLFRLIKEEIILVDEREYY